MTQRIDAVFDRLAQERASRAKDPSSERATQLLARLFPLQRAVVDDPSRRKAVLCAGRAGKSFMFAVYILVGLLTIPRANILYIAFIRSEAKEIIWNLLKALNDEFQLGLHFSEQELTITNKRGAWARIAGCESWGDVDKFRGVPRHLVILDETATWPPELLKYLIREVIEPRLGDYKGTLLMGGTPGSILAGLFYEATNENATKVKTTDDGVLVSISRPFVERASAKWQGVEWIWSLHGWALKDNTSERGQSAYEEALALKRKNGWSDDNPIWMREYLGRWMADGSRLVFRYDSARDDWDPGERTPENPFGLPEGHAWRYVLCCDMGFHDPFALQVGAFSDTHPDLHQVYEWPPADSPVDGTGMTVGGVAEQIERVHGLIDADDIEQECADLQGLGGMVVETLSAEHGIHLEKLEQREKRDHIEITNSGLVERRIKVLRGSRLSQEMAVLAWDQTGLKTRPNQRNNNCDAFLGVVRHSRHLEARPITERPKRGTPEYLNHRELEEETRIAAVESRRARNNSGLNDASFID